MNGRAAQSRGLTAGMFWPFSARAAVLVAPATLIGLLILLAILRGTVGWPDRRLDGSLLLGIVVLSLVPVLLLVLNSLATQGGSLEAFGVRLRWAEVASATTTVTVSPKLGLQEGEPLTDASTARILDTLHSATHHDVALVDLKEGEAWWETRLLVLCAGAARLGRPRAIVFVATEEGQEGRFQGWAPPQDLVRRLLAHRVDLREAHDHARAVAAQWDLAVRSPGSAEPPRLPWDVHSSARSEFVFPYGERFKSEFADERLLAEEVGHHEEPTPKGITLVRLRELFAPCLRTSSIDESADDTSWVEAVFQTSEPFIAVTRQRRYVGLMPRERAINDILATLAGTTNAKTPGSRADAGQRTRTPARRQPHTVRQDRQQSAQEREVIEPGAARLVGRWRLLTIVSACLGITSAMGAVLWQGATGFSRLALTLSSVLFAVVAWYGFVQLGRRKWERATPGSDG